MSIRQGFTFTIGFILALVILPICLVVVAVVLLCGGALAVKTTLDADSKHDRQQVDQQVQNAATDHSPPESVDAGSAPLVPEEMEPEPVPAMPVSDPFAPVAEPIVEVPEVADLELERKAQAKLMLAKKQIEMGKAGSPFLEQIIDQYPQTNAAQEAATILSQQK